jgi:hypothetical protein
MKFAFIGWLESRNRNMMRLSEHFFLTSKCFLRSKQKLQSKFSLELFAHVEKVRPDLIVRAFKQNIQLVT